jgi:hypothetical protein
MFPSLHTTLPPRVPTLTRIVRVNRIPEALQKPARMPEMQERRKPRRKSIYIGTQSGPMRDRLAIKISIIAGIIRRGSATDKLQYSQTFRCEASSLFGLPAERESRHKPKSSALRNRPFREAAVKAPATKQAPEKCRPEKGSPTTRAFPICQACGDKEVKNKCHCEGECRNDK